MAIPEFKGRSKELCSRHTHGAQPGKKYPLYPNCPVCQITLRRGERAVALLQGGMAAGTSWVTKPGTADEVREIVNG